MNGPDPKHRLYSEALLQLARRDKAWRKNFELFVQWGQTHRGTANRSNWIDYIERSAENGLPMAVELVTEVAKVRLTR